MNRPLSLKIIPKRFRTAAYFRLYSAQYLNYAKLYENALLSYAPEVHLKLMPGDLISGQIAFTGFYELALTRRITKLAKKGGTMIDIGANLGYFSCLWVSGNAKNKCFAFEASPRIVDLLKNNIKVNGFSDQITLFPVAAGYESGRLGFDVGPEDQSGWGGFTKATKPSTTQVDVVRVDQVIPSDLGIDLLKVDIEGADSWALMGCEKLLKKHIVKEIWYEQNKPRMRLLGISLDEGKNFLKSLGYEPIPQNDPSDKIVEWCATLNNK